MGVTEILSENDPKLFLEADLVTGTLFRVGLGLAVIYSSRCPGKDSPNEDAALLLACSDDKCVFAVADGAGGARAGSEAACRAITSLAHAVRDKVVSGGEIRTGVLNGFEEGNRTVRELNVGAVTTLAVVEINKTLVRPYHVGDSLVLVVGQRGKIKQQTISHSPVGYGIEAGYLDETDAMFHEERHIVSNLVGTSEMRIDIGHTIELAPKDTVLIASDGLSDNLYLDEIVEIIRKGELLDIADELAKKSTKRMQNAGNTTPSKPDDLTFILFRLTDV
jgi:PPM family protein phosphatase